MFKNIDASILSLVDHGVENVMDKTGLTALGTTRVVAAIALIVQAVALYPHYLSLVFSTLGLLILQYYTETTVRNTADGILDYGIRLAAILLTVLFSPILPVLTTISALLVIIYFYVIDCDIVIHRPRAN